METGIDTKGVPVFMFRDNEILEIHTIIWHAKGTYENMRRSCNQMGDVATAKEMQESVDSCKRIMDNITALRILASQNYQKGMKT